MSILHICQPTGYSWRSYAFCTVCDRKRRVIVTEYEWYGPTCICTGCGCAWYETHIPWGKAGFKPNRNERTSRIASAKAAWATAMTKDQAFAALFEAIAWYCEPEDATEDATH